MPAKSKAQQRLFGMAYDAKKNNIPSKELSPEVARLKKMLSKKQLKDFAATKTEDLPEHKDKEKSEKRASLSEKISKYAASIKVVPAETVSVLPNTKSLNLKQFKDTNTIKRASLNEKMHKYSGAVGRLALKGLGLAGKGIKNVGKAAWKNKGTTGLLGLTAYDVASQEDPKSLGELASDEVSNIYNKGVSHLPESWQGWLNDPKNKKMLADIGSLGGAGLGSYALSSLLTSGMDDGWLKSTLRALGTLGATGAAAYARGYTPSKLFGKSNK
jgi:hypothetical protein